MLIRFHLSMDGCGSWNGVDTGKKPNNFAWFNVPKEQANEIIKKGSFHYDFGDGWWCNVYATLDKRSKTSGFRGYEWMCKEIIHYGKILSRFERKELREKGEYFDRNNH